MSSEVEQSDTARRAIGPLAAMALVVGSMLGIGIFIAPPQVARLVASPFEFLALWLAAGVMVWSGAVCLAELGSSWPRSGGDIYYLRMTFGPVAAVAVGWLQLLAIFPGSLATVSLALVQHQLAGLWGAELMAGSWSWGLLEFGRAPLWALAIVFGLSWLNYLGVRLSARVQVVITALPIAALAVASVIVLLRGDFSGWTASAGSSDPALVGSWYARWAEAFLPVYFAYSGWNTAIYVAGEIREPGRSVPRAFLLGVALVTVVYCLACAAFIAVLGLDGVGQAFEVGSVVAREIWGDAGQLCLSILIAIALLGSLNATVMAGARIVSEMAASGGLHPSLARVDRRRRTPGRALLLQALLTGLLLLLAQFGSARGVTASNTLDILMSYVSSAMLIAGSLTVACVPVLRRRDRQTPRPYAAPSVAGRWIWPAWLHISVNLAVLAIGALAGNVSVIAPIVVFAVVAAYRVVIPGDRSRAT